MLTVKEIVPLLKDAKDIRIGWNGSTRPFDKEDSLLMDAFGDYLVRAIVPDGMDGIEIHIATTPLKVR